MLNTGTIIPLLLSFCSSLGDEMRCDEVGEMMTRDGWADGDSLGPQFSYFAPSFRSFSLLCPSLRASIHLTN